MQNVVRPTLVVMATKFGLGAEIQSSTGLSVCLYVCMYVCHPTVRHRHTIRPLYDNAEENWAVMGTNNFGETRGGMGGKWHSEAERRQYLLKTKR